MSKTIKVQIYGQTFPIRGDLDEAYVHRLAEYVDKKMRAVAAMTPTVDTQKVAILAALAIADELHALKQSREDSREKLRERAERCLKLVERALQQSA